jgi:hypothetical protein
MSTSKSSPYSKNGRPDRQVWCVDAKFYSTLDAKAGYHQMPLAKEDCEITAFVVPWGHLPLDRRTPFGLKRAGYTFQRMMAKILAECNYDEVLFYLDDVLVWSVTGEEHLKRLRKCASEVEGCWSGVII